MNSIFIILITYVQIGFSEIRSETDPAWFASWIAGGSTQTVVYKTHEDCQNGLMEIFTRIPSEENPIIKKDKKNLLYVTTSGDGDQIRITSRYAKEKGKDEHRKLYTCHKITF